ncbi:MAG: hypothetical protein JNL60_04470 [Bacteroidia bacterium]|nr:hypothetical protein [Bacteroidia bacterium]
MTRIQANQAKEIPQPYSIKQKPSAMSQRLYFYFTERLFVEDFVLVFLSGFLEEVFFEELFIIVLFAGLELTVLLVTLDLEVPDIAFFALFFVAALAEDFLPFKSETFLR